MNAYGVAALEPDGRYSYAYGTVSALHPLLLKAGDLEQAAGAAGIKEALAFFENTDYAEELSQLGASNLSEGVHDAVESHFLRVYRQVVSSLPEEDRTRVGEILLGEYDLKNLKAIVRGVGNSISARDITMMLSYGTIDRHILEEMAGSGGMDALLRMVMDVVGDDSGALEKAAAEYGRNSGILPVEMALDRLFVGRWLSSPLLVDYVKMKVDVVNIVNLFRCRLRQMDYGRHLLAPGLHLEERFLKNLGDAPTAELTPSLEATPYGPSLRKAMNAGGGISLPAVEHALEDYLEEETALRAMLSPLSAWPVLHYIRLKQSEVRNVKTVLLLKACGLQGGEITRRLV